MPAARKAPAKRGAAAAPKGRITATGVFTSEAQAQVTAATWRYSQRKAARVYKRSVRADGVKVVVWMLVVREPMAKGGR